MDKIDYFFQVKMSGRVGKSRGTASNLEQATTTVNERILKVYIKSSYIRVGPDIQFGRISDIEISRPVIQYCRILNLLKLSGRISDNLVFYMKQNWHYPAGYSEKPDIRSSQPYPIIIYRVATECGLCGISDLHLVLICGIFIQSKCFWI